MKEHKLERENKDAELSFTRFKKKKGKKIPL